MSTAATSSPTNTHSAIAEHGSAPASPESGRNTLEHRPVLVVGGGPAGLTAAYSLLKTDSTYRPLVVEASEQVGGIARTEQYKGYRFDIGGHRFFTKVKEVENLWHEIMGADMMTVPRQSRIYYQGKFYDYPLKIGNTLGNLGPRESVHILLSYFKWKFFPSQEEQNLQQWVSNRFGGRLYWHFFRTYTEKVWGIPCTEIRADWAAQRIKNLSLRSAVFNAITRRGEASTLIQQFEYPRLGPGQMWERFAEAVNRGSGEVRMQTRLSRFHREGQRIKSAELAPVEGESYTVGADDFVTTMPLNALIHAFDPPPPEHVVTAANSLKYRDFLIVTLILDHPDPFPDNWIYIHSPEVKVGRIQNFRAWSQAMVPDPNHASIGMEYFCHEGDGLWQATNAQLIEEASAELNELGLAPPSSVIDGTVIRQPKAYPVYDAQYKQHVETIRHWLGTLENLQTVGRNAMHRYNNQDHSMLAALCAARNIMGDSTDPWEVNVERSYHENFVLNQSRSTESARG